MKQTNPSEMTAMFPQTGPALDGPIKKAVKAFQQMAPEQKDAWLTGTVTYHVDPDGKPDAVDEVKITALPAIPNSSYQLSDRTISEWVQADNEYHHLHIQFEPGKWPTIFIDGIRYNYSPPGEGLQVIEVAAAEMLPPLEI